MRMLKTKAAEQGVSRVEGKQVCNYNTPDLEIEAVIPPRPGYDIVAGCLVFAAGLVAAAEFVSESKGATVAIAVSIGAVLVGVVLGSMIRFNRAGTRLTLTGRALSLESPLGHRALTLGGPIAQIVELDLAKGRSPRRVHCWLLVDVGGNGVRLLNRAGWRAADLKRLREALEVPLDVRSEPMRAADLRREFPGSIPWWSLHVSLLTVVALVACGLAWALVQAVV